MNGILIDENNDPVTAVKRDAKGLIVQGLVPGDITRQRCRLIIEAQKGEFKKVPTLGFGIDSYLKKTASAHGRQKFITELKSELSSDGINARIRITDNDISKFSIDI